MANQFPQIHALAQRPPGQIGIRILAFALHMQLKRQALLCSQMHRFIQKFV